MHDRAVFLLLLSLLSSAALAANGRPGRGPSSAIDSAKDPRLAARVRLRAEAIPLRRVLRALADATGVRLGVAGSAGDERLVAFVPEASLADVMRAVADLYRLAWIRSGSAARPAYQLLKPPALAQEEQALRERSFQQLRVRLAEGVRAPQPSAGERPEPWAPVYPFVLPLITAHSAEFLRDGHRYLPLAALPAEERRQLISALQPVIDAQHARFREILGQAREQRRTEGTAGPDVRVSGENSGPPAAESSTITAELAVRDELTATVGLKTGVGIGYGWLSVSGDSLQAPGMQLYKDRDPKLPAAVDEEPEPTAEAAAELMTRVVEVPPQKPPSPGDWIGALGRLSEAAGVALYADSYPNYLEGTTGHPRSDFAVSGKISVARALNRLCYPIPNRGAQKLAANSFWWRRGDAALVRSRRWLWESAALLPSDLLDRFTTSLRATGQIDPRDLPAIASLTGLQVQSIGFLDGRWDTWRLAVQLPAQLSLESRKLLLTSGLTGEKMPPADRTLLGHLLNVPPGGALSRYAARLKTTVNSNPAQGGALVTLEFEAGPEQSFVHVPLPGVSAAPGLPPQGLEVTLATREEPRGVTPLLPLLQQRDQPLVRARRIRSTSGVPSSTW
jgi:hypothetical protein